ncbi:MAG: hypothetical protein HYS22_05250 [Deltaproteobacteria bacterium]|nr:hypothetical protein [Deltaproteobacteria bacterium]
MKRWNVFLVLLALFLSGSALSERNEVELGAPSGSESGVGRNPFAPSGSLEALDISEFVLNGLIVSEEKGGSPKGDSPKGVPPKGESPRGYALISGNVVTKGDRLGRYLVEEIQFDKVILREGDNRYPLKFQ